MSCEGAQRSSRLGAFKPSQSRPFLTYSGNFFGLIAEIMGREGSVCGGIGGSQHLAIADSIATAFRRNDGHRRGPRPGDEEARSGVAAVIIGDGTLGQGCFMKA